MYASDGHARAMLEGNHVTRISVRGVAVASATAVTAVGAVVGVASGNAGKPQPVDVAGASLFADVPSGVQAQTVSDNFERQAAAQQDAADAAAQKFAEEAARLQAAAEAQAKADAEKAAQAAAEAQQKAAQEAAARAQAQSQLAAISPGSLQAMALQIIGDPSQYQCFSNIVTRESGWDYTATNPSSGAYGLVQALPGNKMASVGADWRTNPATQIKWGLGYMNDRYGSPCDAWKYWQLHSNY